MQFSWLGYKPFKSDIRIGEYYQWMDDEIKIEVISTPGHSAGSISLIIDDEIAIVGDVMMKMFGNYIFIIRMDNVG